MVTRGEVVFQQNHTKGAGLLCPKVVWDLLHTSAQYDTQQPDFAW